MRRLIEEHKAKVVLIDLSGVPDVEYTALRMLTVAENRQREAGVSVWLVGATPSVLEMIHKSALGKTLGREALLFNVETAVAKYQQVSARVIA